MDCSSEEHHQLLMHVAIVQTINIVTEACWHSALCPVRLLYCGCPRHHGYFTMYVNIYKVCMFIFAMFYRGMQGQQTRCNPLSNAENCFFLYLHLRCFTAKRQDEKRNQSYLTFRCINAVLCLFYTDNRPLVTFLVGQKSEVCNLVCTSSFSLLTPAASLPPVILSHKRSVMLVLLYNVLFKVCILLIIIAHWNTLL